MVDEMTGRILDNRYRLTEKVGSGGMADVYRAQDILLDRKVAVKILHKNYSTDGEFVSRFRKEAQAAAKLSHPNIVNIYDVGCDDSIYYIVMEYISGETLKDVIARQGKLPNDVAVRIAIDIGEALEQAHANGIVHCDIKPHNILVTKSGRVKVADFGIARAINTVTIINKESVLGSVHYFSPEQAAGESVTAQTDIYSLGVVLYEMLTGHVPFEGETAVSIALKHMQEEIPKPGKYNTSITPLLEDCVMKALQKDPAKRFANISEMIAELRLAQGFVSHKTAKTGRHDFATGLVPIAKPEKHVQEESKESVWAPLLGWPVKKIVLGVVLLFLLASGIAFWMFGDFWSPNSVTIPDVAGMQVEAAEKLLKEKRLNVSINEVADETIPVGQVISQSPEAGVEVKTNRTIHLSISNGGSIILVPDLTGLSIEEANRQLKSKQLRLGKIEEREDKTKPLDTIISQSPASSIKVEKGTTVSVVLNKKDMISRVKMPNLSGMTFAEAQQIILENDLRKGTWQTRKGNTPNEKDIVVEQSPSSGQELVRGTGVDLVFESESEKEEEIIDKTKRASVNIRIPSDDKTHHIQITVTDNNGKRVVLDKEVDSGESVNHGISGEGTVRIQVYMDGNLVQDQEL